MKVFSAINKNPNIESKIHIFLFCALVSVTEHEMSVQQ